MRPAVLVSFGALALFVVLIGLAVRAYSGGSWAQSNAPGFRFWTNYWCDLMRADAVNGASNARVALWAKAAFAALAVSLAAYWPVAASLVPSGTRVLARTRWGVVSGHASAACIALVAALPYDTLQRSHAVSTLAAAGFGFLATLVMLGGSLRAGPLFRWRHVFGLSLVTAAAVNIAIYVDIVLKDRRGSVALPIVQKLATGFLLTWMLATLWDARASTGGEKPGPKTPGEASPS